MLTFDSWLAGILGHDVFRVSLAPDEEPASPEALFATARTRQALFYARVPVRAVRQLSALTAAGFNVIDVNVTFERAPASDTDLAALGVRDARLEEQASVLEIAATAFVYSRFHLDPRLAPGAADSIKREWIASYFRRQRGERLLVAEVDGQPAGFLALLAAEKTAVIDLVGVDRAHQGHGVGRRLVQFFIHSTTERYDRLRVGTQVANIPSIRLYEQCGFRLADAAYVLHAHLREGKILR